MYKKNLLIISALFLLGAGFFLFIQSRDQGIKFISAEDVEPDDIIVKITLTGEFLPEEIFVESGTRVVWVNESGNYSWPASDIHPTHGAYFEFDPLEPIPPGKAWVFTFERKGKWNFHNHLRAFEKGVIIVE